MSGLLDHYRAISLGFEWVREGLLHRGAGFHALYILGGRLFDER
jgi:hypothetical protein